MKVLVDFEDGHSDWREGWIVVPHDVTHRQGNACYFDSFGKSPDHPFTPPTGPKIWVPEYGATEWKRIFIPNVSQNGFGKVN